MCPNPIHLTVRLPLPSALRPPFCPVTSPQNKTFKSVLKINEQKYLGMETVMWPSESRVLSLSPYILT